MNESRPQLFGRLAGRFQLTPWHCNDTSGEGLNDTRSLEKNIAAVVTATFRLK
jgi:hypothetical protein